MTSEYLSPLLYSYFIKYAFLIMQSTNSQDWVLWNHIANAVQPTFFAHKHLNINNKGFLPGKNTHQSGYPKGMFYFVYACSMCFTSQKLVRLISYNYITLVLYPCFWVGFIVWHWTVDMAVICCACVLISIYYRIPFLSSSTRWACMPELACLDWTVPHQTEEILELGTLENILFPSSVSPNYCYL